MRDIHLLVSDLDGTLLGDDSALADFAQWFADRRTTWRLAYSSGRLFESVVDVVASTALPPPDAVIAGVGTQLRAYPNGQPLADDWPPESNHWEPHIIRNVLGSFAELELQPSEFQAALKISYYGIDLSDTHLDVIRRGLHEAGQYVDLVYSSSRDLDVLPRGVNKGTAAAELASLWQLEPWQVFVAGDTGNDASMFAQGFRGIIVANAQPELKCIHAPTIYQAARSHAAGVREGLEFWLARSAECQPTRS